MALDLILLLAGIVLTWLTLRDVFETVVVTGGSRASLHVTRRVGRLLQFLYKLLRGHRRGISSIFAPLVLVSSFVISMALPAVAFGMMPTAPWPFLPDPDLCRRGLRGRQRAGYGRVDRQRS